MNLLSTGPVWLFIVFGVVVALLPDTLIGVWEAYSAGEGVLVNQVKPIIYFPTFVCWSTRNSLLRRPFLERCIRLTLTLPIN
jgi:hypothetical protein